MERLQHLISKLNEQNQQKESPLQMLVTLKHIEAELTIMHTAGGAARSNPGVSIVMPSIKVASRMAVSPATQAPVTAAREVAEAPKPAAQLINEPLPAPPQKAPEVLRPQVRTEPDIQVEAAAQTPTAAAEPAVPARPSVAPMEVNTAPVNMPYRNGSAGTSPFHTSPAAEAMKKYQPQPAPTVAEAARIREAVAGNGDQIAPQAWSVDPLMEVPTLSHQPGAPELNDIIGFRNPSINDRLKDNGMTETGYQLKGAPVKELRKAIGVNDRYLFINELFRGDEAMYERSIKTINNFRILPEAQYWMERELKIKIGWDDSRDIVQHFYELVSRRFS